MQSQTCSYNRACLSRVSLCSYCVHVLLCMYIGLVSFVYTNFLPPQNQIVSSSTVAVLGIICAILGTYSSVSDIVKSYWKIQVVQHLKNTGGCWSSHVCSFCIAPNIQVSDYSQELDLFGCWYALFISR
jgi:hypothetical protein